MFSFTNASISPDFIGVIFSYNPFGNDDNDDIDHTNDSNIWVINIKGNIEINRKTFNNTTMPRWNKSCSIKCS